LEATISWAALVSSAFSNAVGVFLIKLGLNRRGPVPLSGPRAMAGYFWSLVKSPQVVLGTALFFLAPFVYTVALSHMEVSVAQPAHVALNFAILMLCAVLFLREKFSLRKIAGLFFVLLGLTLLQFG